ncbi:uncharacterized protein LOC121428686 [Lytechinus variegatus]|uniref:uncharacterized protein LOC121428686 n=1 Tax=Lytechinus variegatus TaxID=7654 RepID=UPI001BB1DC68|nr:uncharacterized protein LOC121428686 [Lytechinus variegatus]
MSTLSSQCQYHPVRSNSRDSNRRPDNPSRAENTRRMPRNLRQLTPVQRMGVYKQVLESNLPFLCSHLDPSRHYAYLRSQSFFDRTTVEVIDNNVTTEAKVRRFVDELLRRGPNAVSAFIESLERERVEQFVFSTLADELQSFKIEDLNIPSTNHNHQDNVGSHENFDIDDDAVCDDERRFHSLSASDNTTVIDGYQAALPPIDFNRLRQAEGLHVPEEERGEPEECSDISSQDGLISHAP